ncbi:MAG: dTMP kinase [Wenzhouxiangella sp.]|nr:MAG: dTMP kinase [Wenzhouxiangella sp.]
MRGRLITLEGGEGAGKSSAVSCMAEWLRAQGRQVVVTREPGGTAAAERIRAVLLDPETGDIEPLTEALLMFAARSENLAQVIRPALAAGQDVICDRFTDASRAYQGGGREMGMAAIDALAELVHPDIVPDLTLVLDVPVAVGMSRVGGRGQSPDRFERTRSDFLERVRNSYLALAEAEPERIALIDASLSIDQVHRQIIALLEERLA